ncbi:MAG: TolB family protein, partial [Bryobacteraceae bacterium]
SRPVWSTDGREILYSADRKLWRVEVETGGLLGELPLNEVRVIDVRVAPPVRNAPLLYTRISEKTAVWKLDVAHDRKKRVVEGDWPDISADGKSIVYTNGGGEIWMRDADGGNARPIHTRRGEVVLEPFFNAAVTRVTVVVAGSDYTIDLETGALKKGESREGRRLFAAEKLPQSPFLAPRPAGVTSDGGTVVFAQYESPGWDIRKIENYR